MSRTRTFVGGLSALALGLTGLAVSAQPAAAAVGCGSTITVSTTLTADVGPCTGDGLIVTGSNITLNLNGKRVFAKQPAVGDIVGIRLVGVKGTKVINGTVDGFNGGVSIIGGSGNTVKGITASNNISDLGGGVKPTCDNGDGISLFDSSNNVITGNTVSHNGPYGGISVVNNSDGNKLTFNTSTGNDIIALIPAVIGGLHPACIDNEQQDEGIRIEGPGADNNQVKYNTVNANILAGIGVHAVNNIAPANEPPNTNTVIVGNTVVNNGRTFSNRFTNVGPTLFQQTNPAKAPFVFGTDYTVLSGSGSGDVTAKLVPVGPINVGSNIPVDSVASGCLASDFIGFPAGSIALVQRGSCGRATKVANAKAAGAVGVVMFNEGSTGRTALLTAGVDVTTIPVLGTTFALGKALYVLTQAPGGLTVHIVTNTTNVTTLDAPSDTSSGIAILNTPGLRAFGNTISSNVANNNPGGDGISIPTGSHDNLVQGNRTDGNGKDGIFVAGPSPIAGNNKLSGNRGTLNVEHDGHDNTITPPCDSNTWSANLFGTVNQPCVANP